MADDQLTGGERAAERAARNTGVRVAGDITGKLLSLVLFALLARSVSQAALGAYVFAFAWVQIATVPIGLGFDRFLVRRVAKDRSSVDILFWNIVAMKALRAIPVVVVSWVLVGLLHHDDRTRLAVVILTFGLLLDLLMRTAYSVFTGLERGELVATTVVTQRFANAALGIAALGVGFGVLGVAASYTISSALASGLCLTVLVRRIGMPKRDFARQHRLELRRASLPFAAQDVFLALLDKIDAVILSLLGTAAAVGRYGAAYRLLEATFFISQAMTGAFSAMYTYLEHDSEPTVGAVYQRSLKLALATLVPCGVLYGTLAEPLTRLLFGADLATASGPLRVLAPVVVLLGIVVLSTSLVVSRGDPRSMAHVIFGALATNVALNVALIPTLADTGAAVAMLLTYAIFLVLVGRMALRLVGGIDWTATFTGPLTGGAAMGVVALLLAPVLAIAIPASVAVYLAVLVVVERRTSRGDLDFVVGMIRRRLPRGAARRPAS